jgi:DNA-binding response OmpR family regulator
VNKTAIPDEIDDIRPVPHSSARTGRRSIEPLDRAVSKAETVLVLDHERVLRQILAGILRYSGYRVLEASSGSEAQRLANERKIQLLILDLDTSGLELTRWFRAIHPEIKVLATSSSLWDLNYRVADLQEIAFLSKPFTPPKLIRLVRRILL